MADDLNQAQITPESVVAAFGDYYLDSGQNMSNLHMLPFEEFGTQEAATVIETNDTILREANVEVQEVLQQYQDEFTSKGGMDFDPVEIMLYNVKVDIAIVPQKLRKTWLGFLTNNDKTPENYPFIAWFIEQYVMMQINQDLEKKAIYTGIYKAPEIGIAGNANETMNGIEKLLVDAEAANKFDFINTGAIATAPEDFVTQIEDFVQSSPELYRTEYDLTINMSRTLRDKFRRGMRKKYNMYYDQRAQLTSVVDFDNITIEGRASMMGKSRIWTTPKFNLLSPVKGFTNKNGFDIQKFDRKVKLLTDFWVGVGFVQPKLIFANELT